MKGKRRQHGADFKARVALAALKGDRTINEVAAHYEVHPAMVTTWKQEALAGLPGLFARRSRKDEAAAEVQQAGLYEQIGRLKVELDWLKKSSLLGLEERRVMIQIGHPEISVRRQCALLGLSRSGFYYEPVGPDAEDLALMRLLDEQYTRTPFYGVRKMRAWLETLGRSVGINRVRRLLRKMGISAMYPQPRLSFNGTEHRRFPYLLRGVKVLRPNQVWSADITYIRLDGGFVYLVAILDWFSRYVLSWELSNTLDAGFCLAALEEALLRGSPEIFNTDQGVQFTSADFVGRLEKEEIRISMDGKGRCFDNIFVERLWRSVKYEEVYLNDYATPTDVRTGLGRYFPFYNGERLHEALAYLTPSAVYRQGSLAGGLAC
ncbi:MAG: IS3 family transposase [Actinomycetota bacterium]